MMHSRPPHASAALERARALRAHSTEAEHKLWNALRGRQLNGLKFRRQHPMPPYTVDFLCMEAKLIIELDGSQHSPAIDLARTEFLQRRGFTVLRFWNHEVLLHIEAVADAILQAAHSIAPHPNPSPAVRGT